MHAYETFFQWLANKSLDFVRVVVDIDVWNQLAPAWLDVKRLEVYPNHPIDVQKVACVPEGIGEFVSGCWVRQGERPNAHVVLTISGASIRWYHLQSVPAKTTPVLPQMAPETGFDEVIVRGVFEGIRNIPVTVPRIILMRVPLMQDDLRHLARFEGTVRLQECTFVDCTPVQFHAERLEVTCNALNYVDSISLCRTMQLCLTMDASLTSMRPDLSFPLVTSIIVSGEMHANHALQIAEIISTCFPAAESEYQDIDPVIPN